MGSVLNRFTVSIVRNVCHVSRDPVRSAHMIILLKLLCLAAYEGFVLNKSALDIEQQPLLVSMKEVNV